MKHYVIGKVKRTNNGKEVRCACGGQCMVDAEGTYRVPIGFGCRGGHFVIDSKMWHGYFGECLKCRQRVFAPEGKAKLVTRKPRIINQRLHAMRQQWAE